MPGPVPRRGQPQAAAPRRRQVLTTNGPTFYTMAEVAEILRVGAATAYRSIRANAFPAVRIRSRYVIPAGAVIEMAEEAARSGGCIDLARRTYSVRQHRPDHQR